jgi:thiol-disulfide isomerase/thioredoxin
MKTQLLFLFMAVSAYCFSQSTSTVSGKINNPTGEKVYLRYYEKVDGKWTTSYHDSCVLDNGIFKLSAQLDSLTYIELFDGNEMAFIYLAPNENLKVSFNTLFFDETIIYSGDGSNRNNLMKNIFMIEEALNIDKYMAMYRPLKDQDMDTTQLFKYIGKLDSTIVGFIENEKTSYPELEKVLDAKIASYAKNMDRLRNNLRKKAKKERLAIEVKGKAFMTVNGVNLEGKKVSLSDYYGQIMVLDFWATWCGPCKVQFPDQHVLEEKYKGKVTFMSVGVWCKEDEWRAFAKEEGFENNIFLDKEEADKLQEPYMLTSIPRYMILDAEGKIVDFNAGRPSSGLSGQLDELL